MVARSILFVVGLLLVGAIAPKPTPTPTTTAPTTTAPPPTPSPITPSPGTYTLYGSAVPDWVNDPFFQPANCPGTMGVRWYSNTTTGNAVGLRIISSAADVGNVMIGRLWSKTGVALSPEVSFPATDGTNKWLEVSLPSSVGIDPYTEYVASVYCGDSSKHVISNENGLYGGRNSAPHLSAYPGSAAPGNGVYLPNAKGFPNQNFGADGYVDIIYVVPSK